MAKMIGIAGKTSRDIEQQRRYRRLLMLSMALAIAIIAGAVGWKMFGHIYDPTITITVSSVLFVALLVADWLISRKEIRMMRREERRAARGAAGEEAIGTLLAQLSDDYTVFHDLAKVAGDIDHIVVGPTGVFVLETKTHRGKISCSGASLLRDGQPFEKDIVAQAVRNAVWVHDVLRNVIDVDTYVVAVLVFTSAFVPKLPPVRGVRVVNKRYLLSLLQQAPRRDLPREQIVTLLAQKMGHGATATPAASPRG
jgi:hypothetical protein